MMMVVVAMEVVVEAVDQYVHLMMMMKVVVVMGVVETVDQQIHLQSEQYYTEHKHDVIKLGI